MLKLEPTRHRVAIAGQVLNTETQRPIANARVELTTIPEVLQRRLALKALQYGEQWEYMNQRPDRTYSKQDGFFHFVDLPAGHAYGLRAARPKGGIYHNRQPMAGHPMAWYISQAIPFEIPAAPDDGPLARPQFLEVSLSLTDATTTVADAKVSS